MVSHKKGIITLFILVTIILLGVVLTKLSVNNSGPSEQRAIEGLVLQKLTNTNPSRYELLISKKQIYKPIHELTFEEIEENNIYFVYI
ncbi:hypothetical protein ACSVDA_14420 [Cytobacillus sp. Hm23]